MIQLSSYGTHQTPRERLSEIVDATRKVFKNAGKSGKGVDVEDMRLGAYSVCISYLVNEDIYPLCVYANPTGTYAHRHSRLPEPTVL